MRYEIENVNNQIAKIYGYEFGHCTLIMECKHSTVRGSWNVEVKLNTAGYHAANLAAMVENRELEINVPDYRHTLAYAIRN